MRPNTRHLTASHVWLFQAGVDADALDFQGKPLSQSLAELVAQAEADGRKSVEDTGSYDVRELEKLISASKRGW